MEASSQVVPPGSRQALSNPDNTLGAIAEGDPVRLPDLATLFQRRSRRLAGLAEGHELQGFLRMIADAFDGKLRPAKYDPAISEANWRARINGKRKQERSHPWRPLFSELNDAMASVLTEIGYKNGPTPDGLRRRHEILGYSLSKKQGRHRGEKPKPTGQSKDTKPLTAEEKKTIRDLEWSIPKAQIEREIGRPYKRTDDGDYVAVRAGS